VWMSPAHLGRSPRVVVNYGASSTAWQRCQCTALSWAVKPPLSAPQALRRGGEVHESLIVANPTVNGSIIMTSFLFDATAASWGPVATYDLPRWWALSRAHHHGG